MLIIFTFYTYQFISGNLIGGEAFVFKLRDVNTTSNEDMLVQAHIDETKERRWRYEKHACGENAKVMYTHTK